MKITLKSIMEQCGCSREIAAKKLAMMNKVNPEDLERLQEQAFMDYEEQIRLSKNVMTGYKEGLEDVIKKHPDLIDSLFPIIEAIGEVLKELGEWIWDGVINIANYVSCKINEFLDWLFD